ncbi:MAG: NeuD/PglB/VioB family sugar acetyltransferase [Desulfovibrionaceae bacterium]|nr:NeuD/PglB/VioB family sugar acetyltransferase [Desulfovibrionaceae bacterium]
MKDLYIVGAGGFGRELLNLILDIQALTRPRWNIAGFLDDTEDPLRGKACDFPVVGTIADYSPKPGDALAMGIASPAAKSRLVPMLKARGAVFESIIHPRAYRGRHNTVGEGVIICAGFSMTVNVEVGNFVTLLGPGILGHDVRIGDYSTISVTCNILGRANLGQGVFVGSNAAIAPRVHVGDAAYICMGSMVMKDVGKGMKVMGNPAREIGVAAHV